MSKAGRVTTQPLRPFVRLPSQTAAPIAAGSTTNACVAYTDGTSLLVSINAAAYVALMTAAGGTFTGPVTIDTSTAPAFSIDTDAVSGTIAQIRHDVATTPTSALTGLLIDLQTNWVAGNVAHTGLDIRLPATTQAASSGVAALSVRSQATLQRVSSWLVRNTTAAAGGIHYTEWDDATTFAGAVRVYVVDGTTNVTGNNQQFIGMTISTAAAIANTSSVYVADWRGTAGTAVGTGIIDVSVGAATTLTGQLVGIEIDLSANVTAGANAVIGQRILLPASTSASSAAISVTTAQTASNGVIIISATGTANGTFYGLNVNLLSVTPGSNLISGFLLQIPATTRAYSSAEGVFFIDNRSTAMATIAMTVKNVSGTIIPISWASATTLTGAMTMLNLDGTTGVTGGSVAFSGIVVSTPAAISSASFCARFDYRGTAGTGSGFGIINIEVGGATTLTGQLVGAEIDLTTNVTPGAVAVIGGRILIPATTRANTAGEAALVIASDATAARAIDVDVANTSGTLMMLRWGAGTTLAGSTTMLNVDGASNVTGGSQAFTGIVVTTPAAITSASYCASFDFRGTAGTASGNGIVNIEVGAATVLTGQLVGIECDLTTNVTPGAVAFIGMRISTPATTRADTAGEASLVIASDAIAARVIDIDVANTGGTLLGLRYGASTSIDNAVTGISVDLSTNFGTNLAANIGLDVTMLAADRMTSAPLRINGMRIFANAGIPITANGSNGDVYFDTAGDKDSFRPTIYQRQAGAWVAIA